MQPQTLGELLIEMKKMNTEMETRLQTSMDQSCQNVKTELTREIAELKKEHVQVQTDLKEIKTENSQIKTDLSRVQLQLKMCQIQLNEVIGVAIRQDHILNECVSSSEVHKSYVNRKTITIWGLQEIKEGETCIDIVQKFFKEKLRLKEDIGMNYANQSGKGRYKLTTVHLKDFNDKKVIFTAAKNLKGLTGVDGKPFQICSMVSARQRATQRRFHQIKAINNKNTAGKLNITTEKAQLKIEGETYQKKVRPPSCAEMLRATAENRRQQIKLEPAKGRPVVVDNQTFVAYTKAVRTTEEINVMYAKLRARHASSRHLICAYRLIGSKYHEDEDFF